MNFSIAEERLQYAISETAIRNKPRTLMFSSIKAQLEYALASLRNENDRSRLSEVMFYYYANQEIEDKEFVDTLTSAYVVVDLMLSEKL